MKEIIEEMLHEITNSKKENKIEPAYVLRRELLKEIEAKVYRELKELREEGKISRGETINDYWIELIKK